MLIEVNGIEINPNELEIIQNCIADASFQYGGNSLDIIEIVTAIKAGYRLYLPVTVKENDAEPRNLTGLLDTKSNSVYVRRLNADVLKKLGCEINIKKRRIKNENTCNGKDCKENL